MNKQTFVLNLAPHDLIGLIKSLITADDKVTYTTISKELILNINSEPNHHCDIESEVREWLNQRQEWRNSQKEANCGA